MRKIWGWLFSPAVAGCIGIAGLALAVYTTFFYERKPELSFSVDAMSKVFDLYRPVGGLEVFYAGENLRSSKKNLWVLTATIKNSGNAEIRKDDYDDKAPLGLEIRGAVIAERPTLMTNVNYLSKNLSLSTTDNRILFSPVILEAGDSFEVTTLLLGSESSKPTIAPIGKLAGIKSITLSTPDSPSPEKSVWSQAVVSPSILVHLIRVLIYFVGLFFAAVLLTFLIMTVMSPFQSWKAKKERAERQRRISSYRQYEELGKESRYLIDQYVAKGEAGLAPIAMYLRAYTKRSVLLDTLTGKIDEKEVESLVRSAVPFHLRENLTEDRLKSAKLAEGDGIRVKISDKLEEALSHLCRFLDIDLEQISSISYTDIDEIRHPDIFEMIAMESRDQVAKEENQFKLSKQDIASD